MEVDRSELSGGPKRGSSPTENGLPPERTTRNAGAWSGGLRWVSFLCIPLLYLAACSGAWYPKPDSALYLLLAQNLSAGRGYFLWGEPHVHVPPGYPLLLSLSGRLRPDSLLAPHIAQTGLTLLALLFAWLCLRRLTDEAEARDEPLRLVGWRARHVDLAILLLAISHTSLLLSVQLLSEPLFAVLFWGGMWLLCQPRLGPVSRALAILAIVVCGWVRLPGLLLAGLLACLMLLGGRGLGRQELGRKQAWWQASLLMAGCLASAWWMREWYRESTGGPQRIHLESYVPAMLEVQALGWPEKLGRCWSNLRLTSGEFARLLFGQEPDWRLCLLLVVPSLWGLFCLLRTGAWLFPVLSLCYLAGQAWVAPLQDRHLWPLAPVLLASWFRGCEGILHLFVLPQVVPRMLAVLAGLLVAAHVPKDLRLAAWQRWPALSKEAAYRSDLSAAASWLRTHASSAPFLATSHHRELAFLSGAETSPYAVPAIGGLAEFQNWCGPEYRSLVVCTVRTDARAMQLATLAKEVPDLELVLQTDDFQIYARRRPSLEIPEEDETSVEGLIDEPAMDVSTKEVPETSGG